MNTKDFNKKILNKEERRQRTPKTMETKFFKYLNNLSQRLTEKKVVHPSQKQISIKQVYKCQPNTDGRALRKSSKFLRRSSKAIEKVEQYSSRANGKFRMIFGQKNAEGEIFGNVCLKYECGEKFYGKFKNNERISGKVIFESGIEYEGGFKNDEYDGQGKIKLKNGTLIQAIWKEGEVEPYGKIEYPNGDLYIGSMENFKKEGYGELHIKSRKQKFIGTFKNGEIQGWGILEEYRKGRIEGTWSKGILVSLSKQL